MENECPDRHTRHMTPRPALSCRNYVRFQLGIPVHRPSIQQTVCNGAALLSSFGEDTTPVFAMPRQSQNSKTPKHVYVQSV